MKEIVKENGQIWEIEKNNINGMWDIRKILIGTYVKKEKKNKKIVE